MGLRERNLVNHGTIADTKIGFKGAGRRSAGDPPLAADRIGKDE